MARAVKGLAVHPHIRGAYVEFQKPFALPPVHPHIRGAYNILKNAVEANPGSSPHTWGILFHQQVQIFCVAVHPHIRGAYPRSQSSFSPQSGSSPHTWGILAQDGVHALHGRFIPTYVGHTDSPSQTSCIPPVHPHIRGAYSTSLTDFPNDGGSSPHTWGIPFPTLRGLPGETVHPHIRGAYQNDQDEAVAPAGSSPHTWGIQVRGKIEGM